MYQQRTLYTKRESPILTMFGVSSTHALARRSAETLHKHKAMSQTLSVQAALNRWPLRRNLHLRNTATQHV